MLSYIYRIICEYRRSHDCDPNVLYLNRAQFHQLRHAFADPDDIEEMGRLLQMHIIISNDALHPRLARIERRRENANGLPEIRKGRAKLAQDRDQRG